MLNAKAYGEALFLLSEEQKNSEQVLGDILTVKKLIKDNPKYCDLADTPALATEERVKLVGEAFGGFDKILVNMLKILCEKREFYQIIQIAEEYMALYDESRGLVRVTAITAVEMSDGQTERLKCKLSAELKKEIIVTNIVDSKILGGMKLRYGGVQLDGSLKANLEKLETAVKSAIVP